MRVKVVIDFWDKTTKKQFEEAGLGREYVEKLYKKAFEQIMHFAGINDWEFKITTKAEYGEE